MNQTFETKVMNLNTSLLKVDYTYQRGLNAAKVARIVREFDPNLVNKPKVSYRDGSYYVFDGQHTIAALTARNHGEDVVVACTVFFDMTQRDEMALFVQQNGISDKVSMYDKLRAMYNYGDPEITNMVNVAQRAGVTVAFKRGNRVWNKCSAVGQLLDCYRALPEPLLNIPLDTKTQIAIYDLCDGDNGLFCAMMAMACVESNFNPTATSFNGKCVGMFQISVQYHTERMNRLGVFDLTDPIQCAAVAIDYLKEMMPEFGDTESHALYMAYNRGASGARTAIANGVTSDIYSRSVLDIRYGYLMEMGE